MTPSPTHLRLAIPIFTDVQILDFLGPFDVFNALSLRTHVGLPDSEKELYSIDCVVLAETLDPIVMNGGLKLVPQMTFSQALKDGGFNAVLVPGGIGSLPWLESNLATREFLKAIVPDLETKDEADLDAWNPVCTGSWLMASQGLLRGRRATSNKATFKRIVEDTKDQGVIWVPKARWVVDGKYWTSSGVTAGIDMAAAFMKHIVGLYHDEAKTKEITDKLLGVLEVSSISEDQDQWAEYYGLV